MTGYSGMGNGGLQAAAWVGRLCSGLKPAVALVSLMTLSGTALAYTERTITYHADASCTLQATVCTPDTGTGFPCIMLIHEGGFVRGGRQCFAQYGDYFTERGYATCAVDYRLVQDGGAYPGALHDCVRALRWLASSSDSLRIDPARIVLLGSSAGAYLAVMTSLAHAMPGTDTVPPVAGVISSFGLYDWSGITWRGDGFLPAGMERTASPVTYVSSARCPYLLLAGKRDRLFGYEQAEKFAAKVKRAGMQAEVRIMPKAGHQGICDLNGAVMQWALPAIEVFLKKSTGNP